MCGDRNPGCDARPRLWDSGPKLVAHVDHVDDAAAVSTFELRVHIPSPRLRGVLALWTQSSTEVNLLTVPTYTIYPVKIRSDGQRKRLTAIVEDETYSDADGIGSTWEFASGVQDYDVVVTVHSEFRDMWASLEVQPDSAMGNAAWDELFPLIAFEVPSSAARLLLSSG